MVLTVANAMQPHGIPVLFAPGNAGSYAQVRSLAAEAARSFYESPGKPVQERVDRNQQELDFFAGESCHDKLQHSLVTLSFPLQPTSTKISQRSMRQHSANRPNSSQTRSATSFRCTRRCQTVSGLLLSSYLHTQWAALRLG